MIRAKKTPRHSVISSAMHCSWLIATFHSNEVFWRFLCSFQLRRLPCTNPALATQYYVLILKTLQPKDYINTRGVLSYILLHLLAYDGCLANSVLIFCIKWNLCIIVSFLCFCHAVASFYFTFLFILVIADFVKIQTFLSKFRAKWFKILGFFPKDFLRQPRINDYKRDDSRTQFVLNARLNLLHRNFTSCCLQFWKIRILGPLKM